MEDEITPNLETPDEAVEYYKSLARHYRRRLSEVQKELEEFQEGSRELEAELEAQLVQAETKNKELVASNRQLKLDNERLQKKLSNYQRESSQKITDLEDELVKTKTTKNDLQEYVRKLEQKNDDFERATRASLMSLEDFENRLNQAIERNAFLENELDEKENMAVLIQRLKDEARDLRQELVVHDSSQNRDVPFKMRISNAAELEERLSARRVSTNASYVPSSASVPHSALNIVGDLLKKVGQSIMTSVTKKDTREEIPQSTSNKNNFPGTPKLTSMRSS